MVILESVRPAAGDLGSAAPGLRSRGRRLGFKLCVRVGLDNKNERVPIRFAFAEHTVRDFSHGLC
jgi:hypothetical protein